ncbi:spindle assembly checkpoint kinase [Cordyceps javanica]|uniref:EKC/KEOPS complex subunit BUD32 n=1 Tax=Cordyceps javanica TaxID=43265 RepID=A0A545UZ99_9HYPO|nr:spindle assembly checkpoint kinase [Cordyceps javanica]TQW06675.1 spindle assembly checkpoint kinase [Cordyceps javanica]
MEVKVEVPDTILENRVVGHGLSSWVFRVDAVAKCYFSGQPELRQREIAIYQRLTLAYGESHERIVPFFGVLDDSLLLEYQPNGSIRQYRKTGPQPIPLKLRLRWAEQVASGVAFIHSKGVLHGDLSCNNIFLDANLDAKIGDFSGSSIDGLPFLTVYETSHALPGDDSVSIKRDLFALGSTFYEVITGHTPFHDKDAHEIEILFNQGQFPTLQDVPAGDLILRCWKGRYTSIPEVLDD